MSHKKTQKLKNRINNVSRTKTPMRGRNERASYWSVISCTRCMAPSYLCGPRRCQDWQGMTERCPGCCHGGQGRQARQLSTDTSRVPDKQYRHTIVRHTHVPTSHRMYRTSTPMEREYARDHLYSFINPCSSGRSIGQWAGRPENHTPPPIQEADQN